LQREAARRCYEMGVAEDPVSSLLDAAAAAGSARGAGMVDA